MTIDFLRFWEIPPDEEVPNVLLESPSDDDCNGPDDDDDAKSDGSEVGNSVGGGWVHDYNRYIIFMRAMMHDGLWVK